MYELLAERLPGAAVISVAHRPAVEALHERQLVIDPAEPSRRQQRRGGRGEIWFTSDGSMA